MHQLQQTSERVLPPEEQSPLAVAQDLLDTRSNLVKAEEAIRQKRVLIAFQPIVNAAQPKRVLCLEALVRIPDEFGRIIPASDFIADIENDEIGRMLDTEVLNLCLTKLARNSRIRISINMSARSIGYEPWRAHFDDTVKREPEMAKRLILEMTEESVNVVPEYVVRFMRDIRQTGMAFALDNFGRGATTFHTFKKFMFDFVKIDQSITRDVVKNPDSEVLVAALTSFCHEFDMKVIVDRIESGEQVPVFQRIGVDYFQGFHFGRPEIGVI